MSSETPLAVTGPRPSVGIDPGAGASADGVLALVLSWDERGHCVSACADDGALQVSPVAMLDHGWLDVLHPDDRRRVTERLRLQPSAGA